MSRRAQPLAYTLSRWVRQSAFAVLALIAVIAVAQCTGEDTPVFSTDEAGEM